MNTNPFDEFVSSQLSPNALYFLQEAARWARFFAIFCMVSLGIGFLLLVVSSFSMQIRPESHPNFSLIFIISAGFMAIYAVPLVYLLKFAILIRQGIDRSNNEYLTGAFRFLRAHYRFLGILMIILLGVHALAILLLGAYGI